MRQLQTEAGAPLTAGAGRGAASEPVADHRHGTWRSRRTTLLLGIAFVVYVLDRLTKWWALETLTPGVPEDLFGSVLRLHLIFNPGAAFSLGVGLTPLFTLVQAGVSVGILTQARKVGSQAWAVGLGLVLGGAAGNLTDRLTRPPGVGVGHVVDFLQLPYWAIFNIADSAVVTGAALIALTAMRGTPMQGRASPASQPEGRSG